MSQAIPKGRILEVTATVILPETATPDQIEEWVEHCIFEQGSIATENPLLSAGYDAENIEWNDTGMYRETIVSNAEKIGNGMRYQVRRRDHLDARSDSEIAAWQSPDDAVRAARALLPI